MNINNISAYSRDLFILRETKVSQKGKYKFHLDLTNCLFLKKKKKKLKTTTEQCSFEGSLTLKKANNIYF